MDAIALDDRQNQKHQQTNDWKTIYTLSIRLLCSQYKQSLPKLMKTCMM